MLTNRQRLELAMQGIKPDKTPLTAYDVFLPKGTFEREMRNRGFNLVLVERAFSSASRDNATWLSTENVPGGYRSTIHTPVGSVTAGFTSNPGRIANKGRDIQNEWYLKTVEDFKPLIYMADDAIYPEDMDISPEYFLVDDDLGQDGIVIQQLDIMPYSAAMGMLGLEMWSYAQIDYPEEVARLIEAHQRRAQRLATVLPKLKMKKSTVLDFCDLNDNISIKNYRNYYLPYFDTVGKVLKDNGMFVGIHAHASHLYHYREVIRDMKLKWVEAFTPPPFSDLTLRDARDCWGDDVFIFINFPETIFYDGYDATYNYTVHLLKSDPNPRKSIGFTEMGMMGVSGELRGIFETGIRAIMDAVDACPVGS